MYLAERLAGHVGSITRIARGIPVGGDLEYADEVTLVRAMQGRREFEVGARAMSNLINEALLRLIKPVIALRPGPDPLLGRSPGPGRARLGAAGPRLLDLGGRLHPARRDGRHLGDRAVGESALGRPPGAPTPIAGCPTPVPAATVACTGAASDCQAGTYPQLEPDRLVARSDWRSRGTGRPRDRPLRAFDRPSGGR